MSREVIVLEGTNSYGHPVFYNGSDFTRQINRAVMYPSISAAMDARDRVNRRFAGLIYGSVVFPGCTVAVRELA